jgi:hypothetical protein
MLDALKQVLLSLSIKVGSTAPAVGASESVIAAAQRAQQAWGSLQSALLTVVGGAVLRAQVNEVVALGDAADEAAQSVGVGVERLQELQYAASFSGIAIDQVNQGLGFLARSIAQANEQGGGAFAEIGVSLVDAQGELRATDSVLLDLADKFQSMPDGPQKTALAMDLFGRGGAKWIPVLSEGSVAIREMGSEAQKLGVVLSADEAAGLAAYADNVDELKTAARGVRARVVVELLPALTRGIELLNRWAKDGNRVRKAADFIIKALSAMAFAFASKRLIGGAQTLVAMLRTVARAGVLASLKIALATGAVALLALLIEDLYTFANGGDSLLGRFLSVEEAKPLRQALQNLGAVFQSLGAKFRVPILASLQDAIRWVAANAESIATAIAGAITASIAVIETLIEWVEILGGGLGYTAAAIVLAYQDAVNWLATAIGDIVSWWDLLVASVAEAYSELGVWSKLLAAILLSPFAPLLALPLAVDALIDSAKALWDWMTRAGIAARDWFVSIGDGIGGFFGDAINRLLDELRQAVLALPDVVVPESMRAWAREGIDATAGAGLGGSFARTLTGASAPTLSVGSVAVSVNGSADMSAPAMQAAVKQGVEESLQGLFAEYMDAADDTQPYDSAFEPVW